MHSFIAQLYSKVIRQRFQIQHSAPFHLRELVIIKNAASGHSPRNFIAVFASENQFSAVCFLKIKTIAQGKLSRNISACDVIS